MAARAKYPTPHEQLLALAADARERGRSFDMFWRLALRPGQPPITWADPPESRPHGCVVWPRDTADRNTSRGALDAAPIRETWRRAYEREGQSTLDRAIRAIAPFLPDPPPLTEDEQLAV